MVEKSLILIALAVAMSAVAAADPPADPAAPAQKQRLVCRGAERQLGSHVRSTRRCRTADQWQEEDTARAREPVSMQVTAGQNDGHPAAQPR
jgi:hypothetical protein